MLDRVGVIEPLLTRAIAVSEDVGPAGAAVERVVLGRDRVTDRSARARYRGAPGDDAARGIVRFDLRVPFELPADAFRCIAAGDDIGHAAGEPQNVERGAIDHLDALHVTGRDARQPLGDRVALAGKAFAVQQDVALCLTQAAPLPLAFLDVEARNLLQ